MGRFYKTAKPEMLDFMFKVPEQAIMTAIKGADAQLEGQEAYLTDLQKQLKTAALDEDEARRKQRVTELEGKIREHSLKLFENPLLAIKEQKGIRDLGQEIYKDLTEGELYAYNTNYATRQKYYEKAVEDATGKDGRLNVDQVKNAMAAFDARYAMNKGAQFNKETGKFNPYGTELLYDYVDKSDYAKKTAEGWESTKYEDLKSSQIGSYWWDIGKKTDVLELDELTLGIYNTMLTDPTVMQQVMQDIQLKAQAKAAQEARLTGGNYKELEDKYFNQFRDEEFGVKDPATEQLALEEVKDEKGQPKINEQTKKPIMRFVNPGNLYRIAQAAADKKNKNDIATTEKMTGADEFAKIDYTKKRELENARALEADKAKVVWDQKTDEFTEQTFEGTTVEEVEAELAAGEAKLANDVEDYKKKLFNILKKDKTGDELDNLSARLHNVFIPNNEGDIDFVAVQEFLKSQNIGGGRADLTSADEFGKNYNKAKINLENKKAVFNTLYSDAENNLTGPDKVTYDMVKGHIMAADDDIKQLEAKLKAAKATNPNSEATKNYESELNKVKQEKAKYIEFNKKIVSKNLNLDPEVKGNKNIVTRDSHQTAGETYVSWGATKEEGQQIQKALQDLKAEELFSILGGATQSKIRSSDSLKMINFNGTTLGKYFKDKVTYTTTYDNEGNIEARTAKDGQLVYKGKVGEYRIAIDDFQEVGANAISTNISGTEYGPNGEERQVNYSVYIPSNELKNNTVSNIQAKYQDEQEFAAFSRKAESMVKNTNSKTTVVKYNNEILYYPNYQGMGKGMYVFLTEDPKKPITVENSTEALKLFKKYK